MASRARPFISVLFAAIMVGCAALPVQTVLPPSAVPSPTQQPTWTAPAPSPNPPTLSEPAQAASPALTQPSGFPPQVAEPVWAANEQEGSLLLIDPADNSVAVIIPTNLRPRWVVQSEGFVWALDAVNDTLIQVDAQTYEMLRVIPFPGRDVSALAAGAGYAWVGVTEQPEQIFLLPDEDYIPLGGILRIDPGSGEITGYAQTGPVSVLSVQTSSGLVWALASGRGETPLLRLDPVSLSYQLLTLSSSDWTLEDTFSLDGDELWIFSSAYGKLYRAAQDGRLYAEIPLERRKPVAPASLLPAAGDIWLATPWSILLRYDPHARRIAAEIELAYPAATLVYAGQAIWAISPLGGAAYRIEPGSNQVVAEVPLGKPASPTPRVSPTPILRAFKPCEDAPYSRLSIGARAATPREPAIPNRIHTEPGKETDLTGYILPGQSVVVLDGPECKDSWVWWQIRNEINHVEGWVAEGDENEYWLIPLR